LVVSFDHRLHLEFIKRPLDGIGAKAHGAAKFDVGDAPFGAPFSKRSTGDLIGGANVLRQPDMTSNRCALACWCWDMLLHTNRSRVTIFLVTLSLQMLSEICLDKSLSLQALAALLGKDERTISRWCERGFVPGAYRMRGGDIRRGKWRVRFPKRNEIDRRSVRFSCNRHEGWTDDQISKCRALDRLLDRIVENTKGFRRSLRYRVSRAPSPQQIDNRKVIAEMARLSEERAITKEPEGALYHDALVNLYFDGQAPEGSAAASENVNKSSQTAPRFTRRTRAPRISRDLMKLAKAKALHNHNEGARRALTMPGLARTLGLPMSWVRRDADLQRLLQKQVYEANRIAGVRHADEVYAADEARGDNGKATVARDFSASQKKMHRAAAAEFRQWYAGLTAAERAKVPADLIKTYNLKPRAARQAAALEY
jgi:hypothetical protein